MYQKLQPLNIPVLDKEFRIAPAIDGVQAALAWRFWVQKNEVYASTRLPGGNNIKISVHESGQLHLKFDSGKDKIPLASSLLLSNKEWALAFQLKYLISDDAFRPRSDYNPKVFLAGVMPNSYITFELLVGQSKKSEGAGLPNELIGASILWKTKLPDGRIIILTGRTFQMDDFHRGEIQRIRFNIKPTINVDEYLSETNKAEDIGYNEAIERHQTEGNIFVMVPLGKESFRGKEDAINNTTNLSLIKRSISVLTPKALMQIPAPNGDNIGSILFAENTISLELEKNNKQLIAITTVTLKIYPDKLIEGSAFSNPTLRCICMPTVNGIHPKSWEYFIKTKFDGITLTAEIGQSSMAFNNVDLEAPLSGIHNSEELGFAVPEPNLILLATLDNPRNSSELIASFWLRDIEPKK